jgi:hypothetical protein
MAGTRDEQECEEKCGRRDGKNLKLIPSQKRKILINLPANVSLRRRNTEHDEK